MGINIEAEKVILAREYNRLTQNELIERLKYEGVVISQGEMSKIEKAERKEVSELLLMAFSSVLNFPASFFTTPCDKKNIRGGLYRKRQSLKKKDEGYIEANINIFKDVFLYFLKHVEILNTDVPHYSTTLDSPSEIAKKTRNYWGISGIVGNLINILENNGILVSYIDIDDDKFDGFSCYLDGHYFIFVNSRLSGDRLRFTIAHELGHIIMQNEDIPYPRCDEEANEFAAEFMLPSKEVYSDLININCEKAYYLKSKWKVSMAALIKRAADISAITPSRYKSLMVQMSKLGYKKKEPNPIQKEKPLLLKEIIEVYMKKRNIKDVAEVAVNIHLSVENFKKFFYSPYVYTNLRIV